MLGGGSTSYLYRKLVMETGLAVNAGAWYMGSAIDDTRFSVYAVPAEGVPLEKLEEAVDRVLRRAPAEALDAEAIERAKTRLVAETVYSSDSQSSLARIYGSALAIGETIEEVRRWPTDIEAVSQERLKTRRRALADPGPLGHRLPDQGAGPRRPGRDGRGVALGRVPVRRRCGPDRDVPNGSLGTLRRRHEIEDNEVPMSFDRDLVETAAQTINSPTTALPVTTAAGIEAWHVESPVVPMIALAFTFEGGAAQDPAGKAGCAQMLARLLDEGAGDLTSDAFQERLAARAIELSFHAGPDAVGGSLKMLVKHADEGIALLALALAKPRLDPDAIERVRGQIIAGLRYQQNDPGVLASRRFFKEAFAGHPYARPVLRHGRERHGDHPGRPRWRCMPASSAGAG